MRRNREEGERKKQRLSSQNPKLKRTKERENSGGQKEKRKRQQAVKVEAQKGKKRKRKTGASREKHLQRLMPTEDERKLQTKLFVKLRAWRSQDRNHRFMMVDFKNHVVSTEKSGLFVLSGQGAIRVDCSSLCGRIIC